MALTEGRRLQLVARGVPVELESLGLGRGLETVEMHIEIGDAVIGIEPHYFLEVCHPAFHCRARDKGQAPVRAVAIA